jgi:mRNA interferase MazF
VLKTGDVVVVMFEGATGGKRRPAVVVSSDAYHRERPDVILGVLTSDLPAANTSTDYALEDWQAARLRVPTAFRSYLGMAIPKNVHRIGQLTPDDWTNVKERLRRALG